MFEFQSNAFQPGKDSNLDCGFQKIIIFVAFNKTLWHYFLPKTLMIRRNRE